MLFNILKRIATKRISNFVFILLGIFFSLPFRTLQQEGGFGNDGLGGEEKPERQLPGELPEEEGACYERNVTEYEVVAVEWVEVYVPYVIVIWVMVASLAKVGKFYSKNYYSVILKPSEIYFLLLRWYNAKVAALFL